MNHVGKNPPAQQVNTAKSDTSATKQEWNELCRKLNVTTLTR